MRLRVGWTTLMAAAVGCGGGEDLGLELVDGTGPACVTHEQILYCESGGALVEVQNLGPVIDVATSPEQICAVRTNRTVSCWAPGATPGEIVPGLLDVVRVVIAHDTTCVLDTEGAVQCWGGNTDGLLGLGLIDAASSTPTPIRGIPPVNELAGGTSGAGPVCGFETDGTAWCWGSTEAFFQSQSVLPHEVPELGGVQEMADRCLLDGGTVWCWGTNHMGQVGDGTTMDRDHQILIDIDDERPVVGLSTGTLHGCAITDRDEVWCWGAGGDGQLGEVPEQTCALEEPCHPAPVQLKTKHPVLEVVALDTRTCVDTGDAVSCTGADGEWVELELPPI